MQRAVIMGRLAVAQKVAGTAPDKSLLKDALTLAEQARRPTGHPFIVGTAYDERFANATCDLARDLVVMGDTSEARKLVTSTREAISYFAPACIGRLAGTLYLLGRTAEGDSFVSLARDRAIPIPNKSERQFALGGIAIGLYQDGRLDQALDTLLGKGITDFGADTFVGGIRGGHYTYMVKCEAAEYRYENVWKIVEASRVDGGFPAWDDLGDAMRSMVAAGLPGDARKLIAHARDLLAEVPSEKVYPTFLSAFGTALWASGDRGGAEKQFTLVRELAVKQTSEDLKAYDLESLARAYAEVGRTKEAVELVEGSFPSGRHAGAYTRRWGAVKDIAMAAVRRGKPLEALQIADLIKEEGAVTDTPPESQRAMEARGAQELHQVVTRAIAMEAAYHGNYADAEEWARRISPEDTRESALADVAALGARATSDRARWVDVYLDNWDGWNWPGIVGSAFRP